MDPLGGALGWSVREHAVDSGAAAAVAAKIQGTIISKIQPVQYNTGVQILPKCSN